MNMPAIAAAVYALVSIGAVGFEIALALGAPLGEYAMGGKFPGRLPPALRAWAVVQALALGLMAAVVVSRAGLAMPELTENAKWLVWLVAAFAAISTVLNAITHSRRERAVWLPVALLLLVSSLLVAAGASSSGTGAFR